MTDDKKSRHVIFVAPPLSSVKRRNALRCLFPRKANLKGYPLEGGLYDHDFSKRKHV